jgi:hypothetical protein
MHYEHTQKGHLDSLLLGAVFAMSAAAVFLHAIAPAFYIMIASAAVIFLAALAFGHMTVAGDDDGLIIRYGPLPLFRKRIPYEKITGAKRARTSWVDGWGIHYVPGRGWTYNLWGFECVELQLDKKKLRIGSDDPDGLLSFLQSRI